MALRVLGLAGSPRRHGNTDRLMDRFLAGAEESGAEVERIIVARLQIASCRACDGCWDDARCVIDDDIQMVSDKIIASDVIVLATPLQFWNVPAQVKALIDRSQAQWARKFIVKAPLPATANGHCRRRGVLICVGGDKRPYFEGILRTVKAFFSVYEIDYWDELLYSGIDAKGEIMEHPDALQAAYELGQRAVQEPWG